MSGEASTTATEKSITPAHIELSVRGMTCQNCVRHVREALQSVPGVASATVDLDAQRATARWNASTQPDTEAAIRAVVQAGYEAEVMPAPGPGQTKQRSLLQGWTVNLALGIPVTLILMLGEWVFGVAMERWFQWLAFALATAVQVICGARFYRGAWLQLKARSSNMDTLVALGSTTAYAYSIWAMFQHTHAYFMEAAAIITLISIGHWLESRMSARAASSMKKLLGLAPAQARRRNAAGAEEMVTVAALKPGDVVSLRPGDRVPTDGLVIEGESSVDESMLTGESIPVDKSAGAIVYGGTVNMNRLLAFRVTATGDATALAQIVAAVERAQNSRASIQRLGDRVSNIFVPVVVVVAILTALWWGLMPEAAARTAQSLSTYLWPVSLPASALAAAIIHCAAVLIIACPCAMGLATPAAIMAGTNAAAERGILIRDGIALEKAGSITSIVFDKTGTLTRGKPEVVEHLVLDPTLEAVPLAATLARHSNHPLSLAVAKLSATDRPIVNWRELAGSGLEASFASQGTNLTLRLGSLAWLTTTGVEAPTAHEFTEQWTARGATMVGLAAGSRLAALFALQDQLKPDAESVVAELKRQGRAVYLLTGDNRRTANAVGELLGILPANVAAEVRPEAKAAFVKSLQDKGQRVAFIGDGINDAPALEQSDLGIAVGRASDVAQMAADIVLLKSDVQAIPEALGLARATLRAIRQNLFWAFFYNALGVPLAALGFMSPILCAAAMGLSDVVVIGNALRLRWWRR